MGIKIWPLLFIETIGDTKVGIFLVLFVACRMIWVSGRFWFSSFVFCSFSAKKGFALDGRLSFDFCFCIFA